MSSYSTNRRSYRNRDDEYDNGYELGGVFVGRTQREGRRILAAMQQGQTYAQATQPAPAADPQAALRARLATLEAQLSSARTFRRDADIARAEAAIAAVTAQLGA